MLAGPGRQTRPRQARVVCSASAASLQLPSRAAGDTNHRAPLQFCLHAEFDEDLDEAPEEEPRSFLQPTAPPLRRALIRAHNRLRHLSVTSRRLLAGGLSAALAKTSTAPLETVKMQLVQSRISALAAAQAILSTHGPLGFFRGNAVDVARTVPSKALELATFEALKKGLRRWQHGDGRHVLPDAMVGSVAGGLAGIVATVAAYPLETVRTRMAVAAYASPMDCLLRMAAEEGPGSLFKGLDTSLVGAIPYSALRLGIYDALRWSWKKATGKHHIDPQAALLFGAFAGVVSSSAVFPFEVIRRRAMMGASYPNTAAAIATIAQQEGAQALFNGVWLSLIKQAPQYAIGFAAYEMAKQWLDL